MLVTTIKELKNQLLVFKSSSKTIGFVPTMGALHSGHLSLITQAHRKTDQVVVSIFVNPTQFNNTADLEKYPRNISKDVEFIHDNYPNTIIFAPKVSEMYAQGQVKEHFNFEGLERVMEGEYRQGHFDGVGTVVKHLFTIVEPDSAFFGEKDYQQLAVIRKLVEITKQPVEIVACATEREANGLAKSSRNERLTEQQKKDAKVIFKALNLMKNSFTLEASVEALKELFKDELAKVDGFELEYIEVAAQKTLLPVKRFKNNEKYRAFAAVYLGKVRLIDNIALN